MVGAKRDGFYLLGLGSIFYFLIIGLLSSKDPILGWDRFSIEDAPAYQNASELFKNHGLCWDGEEYDFAARSRMPVYPLIILLTGVVAASLKLPSNGLLVGLNVVCFLSSIWAVYLVVRKITGNRNMAFASAGMLLLAPGTVVYTLALMPESVSLALTTWGVWFLVSSTRGNRLLNSGLLLGLSVLTKPIGIVAVGLTGAGLMIRGGWSHPRRMLAFATPVTLLLGLWIARNGMLWQTVTLTPNGGSHLYHYVRPMLLALQGRPESSRHPLTLGTHETRVPMDQEAWHAQLGFAWENLGKRHQVLGQLAQQDLLDDPICTFMLVVRNHPRLYAGSGCQALAVMMHGSIDEHGHSWTWIWNSGWWVYQVVSTMFLVFVYVLAARGSIMGWQRPTVRPTVLFCWAGLMALAVMTGPFSHTRYRYPMMPIFCVLAGIGLVMRSRVPSEETRVRTIPTPVPTAEDGNIRTSQLPR